VRPLVVRRVPVTVTKRDPAPCPDPGAVVHDDVLLIDPGQRKIVGLHMHLPTGAAPWQWLRDRLETVDWRDTSLSARGGSRLSGIKAPSKTFGYLPPQPLRNRFTCQAADLERADPELSARLADLGDMAWDETCRAMPGPSAVHHAAVQRTIEPLWRINAGAWTSGIINRNNPLPYHRDSGNLDGCVSAMVCLRRGAHGGHLHIAPYDTWLAIGDRTLTVFDGAHLMHGVSPFALDRHGRRFTIVFYVRRGLAIGAPTIGDELARARLVATSHDQPPA
jgi:hypothetical protein